MINSHRLASTVVVSIGAGLGAQDIAQGMAPVGMSDSACDFAGENVEFHWPNQALLQALREIERIQAGMRFTPGERSAEILREARAGAMYGIANN
jgi:hypothetical protein